MNTTRCCKFAALIGAMTYGNFFPMPGQGVWRIHLEIVRAGAPQPVEANFAYEHPSDQ